MFNEEVALQYIALYCKEGDVSGFDKFYNHCSKYVLRCAKRITREDDVADDLFQEVWIRIYRYVCSFRGEAKLKTWMYKIILQTFTVSKRKLIAGVTQTSDVLYDEGDESAESKIEDDSPSPDLVLQGKEIEMLVRDALQFLTDSERTVFVMRQDGELSIKEIAEQLGVTDGTIKTLHFRAVRKLQKQLKHYIAGEEKI
ncbi:MAG: sigma-70 family RNA polymerase sigma factor [Candidatus Kapaibacterium sp.]|nr:sigma-70 family RNA polymerase sigma factor [Bacteroidota bacterium]